MEPQTLIKVNTLVSIVSTIIVAGATVVLAVLTGRYVRLTGRMVEEMKAAREPAVFFDIEVPDTFDLMLVLGNSGESAATNLRFEFEDTAAWHKFGSRGGLAGIDILRDGMSYLTPGRILKFHVGVPDWDAIRERGGKLIVRLAFENEAGKHFERTASIDLRQYVQVSPRSFARPGEEVAKAIEAAERSKSMERFTTRLGVGRSPSKACPMCAEAIPAAAKKCSHCGEMIDESPPNAAGD